MKAICRIAETQAEINQCRYLIAEVYSREYGVVFSNEHFDLDAKIEPWPHRYVMLVIHGEITATSGIYQRDTYVERYGNVSDAELAAALKEAGATGGYSHMRRREISKVVVSKSWQGRGLSKVLVAAAFSRAFIQLEAEEPHILLMCARQSIWNNVFHSCGIKTRILKPFPFYKVHEQYRSPEDPMDSRLIIPNRDIPPDIYDSALPREVELHLKERKL